MTRASVRVRPAECADAAELAGFLSGLSDAVITPGKFVEPLSDPTRLVLLALDEATSTLVGMLVARPDELGLTDQLPVLHVSHLIVAPKARRHGVGRALLTAVVRAAEERGYDRIMVTVSSGASATREANRYFARIGFAPLMTQRVASTATLRRSLDMVGIPDRLAVLRRARAQRGGVRTPRVGDSLRATRGA